MEQVSDVLNSSLGEEEKLRRALDAAIRLVEAETGALFLKGRRWNLEAVLSEWRASRYLDRATISDCRHGASHGATGVDHEGRLRIRAWSHRKGGRPPSLWPRWCPFRSEPGFTVGVLEVVNRRSGKPFSNWDVLELASLSNQFGLAIENFREEEHGESGFEAGRDRLTFFRRHVFDHI